MTTQATPATPTAAAQAQAWALQQRIDAALYALKDQARALAAAADWPSVGSLGHMAEQLDELLACVTTA